MLGFLFSYTDNIMSACIHLGLLTILKDDETLGIQGCLEEWRYYDCLKGQSVTLFIGQQQIQGRVVGVDDSGLLLIKKQDGSVQAYASGEVSFNALSL